MVPNRGLVGTGDDFGTLKIFNYPCVIKDAPDLTGVGHSSHVMSVKFISGGRFVASTGGKDCAVIVWKLSRTQQTGFWAS